MTWHTVADTGAPTTSTDTPVSALPAPTRGTLPGHQPPPPDDQRVGGWMATFTGGRFWPLHPHPSEVNPLDIAHALAFICRFGGHTRRFYSVAEHCVALSRAVSPKHAAWALLHDAAEAYIGDMVRPLKRQEQLLEFRLAEDQILHVVAARFGLPDRIPDEVHTADSHILHDERAAFLTPTHYPWAQDLERLAPLGVRLEGWPPAIAEAQYLRRMVDLGLISTVPAQMPGGGR